LKPVAYFPDPFKEGDNILVLCETYEWKEDLKTVRPANTNFRYFAREIFEAVKSEGLKFGIE